LGKKPADDKRIYIYLLKTLKKAQQEHEQRSSGFKMQIMLSI
jgi:hypothetical protein